MSMLKTSFARFVVVAFLAPGLLAACADLPPAERSPNSSVEARNAMPARIDRPTAVHVR
jgi:hypothetical protein